VLERNNQFYIFAEHSGLHLVQANLPAIFLLNVTTILSGMAVLSFVLVGVTVKASPTILAQN